MPKLKKNYTQNEEEEKHYAQNKIIAVQSSYAIHIESGVQFEAIVCRTRTSLILWRLEHNKPAKLSTMKTNGFSAFSPLTFEFIVYFFVHVNIYQK